MARPKKSDNAVDTTARILAAAEETFARNGFIGAKLADIAAGAGIRRPSLLYHFKTKDVLYEAVLESAFTAMAAALAQGLNIPGTYAERVQSATDALIAFEASRPHLAQVVLRSLLEPGGAIRERVAARLEPILVTTTQFVTTEGAAAGRPDVPARAAIATVLLGHLLKSTLGDVGRQLFGNADATPELTRALLLGPPRNEATP